MEHGHVVSLETRHAEIEARIDDEIRRPMPDTTILATLKKQKLKIKEQLQGFDLAVQR